MNFNDWSGESNDDREYDVGYRRPPRNSRFQKGRSGNPKGRPEGALGASTILKRELLTPVLAKQNGRQIKITKIQAIASILVNKAISGDYESIRLLFRSVQVAQMLNEEKRRPKGISPEYTEALMRALCPSVETSTPVDAKPLPLDCTSEHEKLLARLLVAPNPIGYGKPPLHSRFQKGRSGNPAGRPLAPQSLRKSLLKLLEEPISVTENGCATRCTRLQVIFRQIINRAARGEVRFYKVLLEYAPLLDLNLRRKAVAPLDPDVWAQQVVKDVYREITQEQKPWVFK